MKTKLLLIFLLLTAYCLLSTGQVPQGFNYQAIARDGVEPISTPIGVKISIQSASDGGTVFWVEEHLAVQPNSSGLFSLVIGEGNRISGTALTFSEIDWTITPKFIKTEIDNTGDYVTMGTSQLWSVPYSTVAGDLKGTLGNLYVKGETTNPEEALFEVKNEGGQTIFAVYNEGVRIYVADGSKGSKGGFAIGGFGASKADTPGQQYLIVSRDSIRAYIWDDPLVKAPKGGFAIGGFGSAKTFTNDYMMISPDSARIYINNASSSKGKKGGFAIGGFGATKRTDPQRLLTVSDDSIRMYIDDGSKASKGGFAIGGFGSLKGPFTKFMNITPDSTRIFTKDAEKGFGVGSIATGTAESYLKLTPDNYFIGHKSGYKISTGVYNSFMGFEAGFGNTVGDSNVFIGYKTGRQNISGNSNVFVGSESGLNHFSGNYNTFLGFQAGYNNYDAGQNVFLGYQTGYANDGYNNVFIGYMAGTTNNPGNHNVFIGSEAGMSNYNGLNNVFIGSQAGMNNTSGGGNIILGLMAGLENKTGSGNQFFGNLTGNKNKSGDYNSFIGDQAGYNNIAGGYNVYLGYEAGRQADTSFHNVMIGSRAGYLNQSDYNIFIGDSAGYFNVTGSDNIYMGHFSGRGSSGNKNILMGYKAGFQSPEGQNGVILGTEAGYNNGGNNNIFIGYKAGYNNSGNGDISGTDNIFLGENAGLLNYSGASNVFIGQNAGQNNDTGWNNTIIGDNAGSLFQGTGNVFIGYNAGAQETGGNKLYIDNSNSTTPLIYGDFTDGSEKVIINGKLGVGVSSIGTDKFEVKGSSKLGTNGTSFSDLIRYTYAADAIGTFNANSSENYSFTVTGAAVGATVSVSPGFYLTDGIVVSNARVTVANQVVIYLRNTTAGSLSVSAGDWYVTIIQ